MHSQFKFVYTNDETEKMVDEVMDPLVKEFGSYVHSRVLIMPEVRPFPRSTRVRRRLYPSVISAGGGSVTDSYPYLGG